MNPVRNSWLAFKALGEWMDDRVIPSNLIPDPESARRARLIVRFGLLGAIFGIVYALFYLIVGHLWGAAIILECTAGIIVTPWLMIWRRSTELPGHFFAF